MSKREFFLTEICKEISCCDVEFLFYIRDNIGIDRVGIYVTSFNFIKGERKKFSKTWITQVFDKILRYTIKLPFKTPFFMFLANFIFVFSLLKVHPAVHLNTSKALTSL